MPWRGLQPRTQGIVVSTKYSPGDEIVASLACAALLNAYPDLKLTFCGITSDLWQYHPRVMPAIRRAAGKGVVIPTAFFKSNADRGVSYPVAMTRNLASQLRLSIPWSFTPPIFPISERETPCPFTKPFVVVCSGHKTRDGTTKFWGTQQYQRVVTALKGKVTVVQIGELSPGHAHPLLDDVVDMRGKTPGRALLRFVSSPWNCGTLSGITFPYWLTAAQGRRTFTICNAREHPSFLSFSPLSKFYFAKPGSFPCKLSNCFRQRVVKLPDGDDKRNGSLCELPVRQGSEILPCCALAVDPEEVIADIVAAIREAA